MRFMLAGLGLGLLLFFGGVFVFHLEGTTDLLLLSALVLGVMVIAGVVHLVWLKVRRINPFKDSE